ncbi:MAG: 3-deoxy-D-manno-octulosonic acid transferase [Muribaculaceae bacterium]|nr:3-deoxy-D-manno-octulosonic acid transferase [Muribaculaceae bacterium]
MILYDLGIWSYRQGVRLASLTGNSKARHLDAGLKETWAKLRSFSENAEGRKTVWIHAASLGEFEQGRPLIERLHRDNPDFRILLTFFSPSGYEVRKNYAEADCVCYLPMDTPRNVRRFLKLANPAMAIFVKYEFWLNYLSELRKRGIPTYLISGIFRESQLFFKPYGSVYRKALEAFTHLYIQDEGSRNLLEGIGIRNTTVAGDTRFDRVTDIMRTVKPNPTLDRFCGTSEQRFSKDWAKSERNLIFMVGSSWSEDEDIYLDWLRKTKGIKGVIAPHEFDDARLRLLLEKLSGEGILLSEAQKNPETLERKKVLIIDCFGLLASAYSYADVAFVGGGFGAGLHNINEAAVYGIPVFYGPNHSKFIEAKEMKTIGGGLAVDSRQDFEATADRLISHPEELRERGIKSKDYISSKLGATDIIYRDLFHFESTRKTK